MATARTLGGLLLPALAILVAARVLPSVQVGPGAAAAVVYVGATLCGAIGVALTLRSTDRPLVLAPIGAAVLVAAALVHGGAWLAAPVASALVALAVGLGGSIGLRVQHAGHFLPAAAMAAAADIVSVTASFGPSHAIAESPRALSLLAISFPVPGTHLAAPALGVGDLLFFALALGVARAHALSAVRVGLAGYLGVLLAGLLSAVLAAPIPALPAIGGAIVAFVPETRKVRRVDRTATTIAVGLALLALAWALVRAKMAPP
ncbi:MAG: hypothetical protein JNL79_02020 [Myxococcales bacterium]|nr:hypothetical protein [Myxococcales bacterium]